MNEFLHAAATFPTIFFSVLLVPVLLYWLLVVLGALDLEVFDALLGGAEGADGALDGAFEGVDGAFEGVEGAAEGLDLDLDADAKGASGPLSALGLGGVPITVSLSLLVLVGWFLSFTAMELWGEGAGLALGTAVLAAAFALSLGVTSLVIRPLRPVFVARHGLRSRELVGRACRVTTLTVTEDFGQAEADDPAGGSVLLQVRCPQENDLTRGSTALLCAFDSRTGSFLVSPMDDELSSLS